MPTVRKLRVGRNKRTVKNVKKLLKGGDRSGFSKAMKTIKSKLYRPPVNTNIRHQIGSENHLKKKYLEYHLAGTSRLIPESLLRKQIERKFTEEYTKSVLAHKKKTNSAQANAFRLMQELITNKKRADPPVAGPAAPPVAGPAAPTVVIRAAPPRPAALPVAGRAAPPRPDVPPVAGPAAPPRPAAPPVAGRAAPPVAGRAAPPMKAVDEYFIEQGTSTV